MEKYLLFTTGGNTADQLNLDSSEIAMYNIKDFKGIKPKDARTLDIYFETSNGKEIVSLGVRNGSHSTVIKAISSAMVKSNQSIVTIADFDRGILVDANIYSVTIITNETYIQSLTGNSRTRIGLTRSNYSKCWIANTHSSDVTCGLELYDGSTYTYLVKTFNIPTANSLILDAEEIAFDMDTYDLYATSNNASGLLTFTFNY